MWRNVEKMAVFSFRPKKSMKMSDVILFADNLALTSPRYCFFFFTTIVFVKKIFFFHPCLRLSESN